MKTYLLIKHEIGLHDEQIHEPADELNNYSNFYNIKVLLTHNSMIV